VILYTIGFTKISAEDFFRKLQGNQVRSVVDVRLKADSQLSAFAKKRDLPFFLKRLLGVEYRHELLLAPSLEMLDAYKKGRKTWDSYEVEYLQLLKDRKVEQKIRPEEIDGCCLLCSEDLPHKCHRRLAAEYLVNGWGCDMAIKHL
jgi:uncharacterized protein (DUF488 family)